MIRRWPGSGINPYQQRGLLSAAIDDDRGDEPRPYLDVEDRRFALPPQGATVPPLMGALDSAAMAEKVKSWLGMGPRPKPAIKPQPAIPAAPRLPPKRQSNTNDIVRRIGAVITLGEGSYESYNTGTKGVKNGRVGHSYVNNQLER